MRRLFFSIGFLFCVQLQAQNVNIKVSVDTNMNVIGKPIFLDLLVDWPENISVEWPQFNDTLSGVLEILEMKKLDTVENEQGRFLQQQISITAFDSGYCNVPGIPFIFKHAAGVDTFVSNSIPLAFLGMNIDMQKGMLDIKKPLDIPFFIDWLLIIYICLPIISLGFLIWYFFVRKKEGQSKEENKPSIPAFVTAIQELELLKDSKTYQDLSLTKEYYSDLTTIIRKYIEFQFGIRALESTTDEILEGAKRLPLSKEMSLNFKNLLVESDLAKFAKAHPTASENEAYLKLAFEFVEMTKPSQIIKEERSHA